MIRVLLKAREEIGLHREAGEAARRLSGAAPASVRVLGPAPAPLYRVSRWYRVHLLLIGPSSATLRNTIDASGVRSGGRGGTQTVVDVDPVDVL